MRNDALLNRESPVMSSYDSAKREGTSWVKMMNLNNFHLKGFGGQMMRMSNEIRLPNIEQEKS